LKSRFHPWHQSPKTTCLTPTTKSSTSCSLVVSIGYSLVVSIDSTKKIGWGSTLLIIGVSFSFIFGVLKTSKAWVILKIKVTSTPTMIYGIINGIGFGVKHSSKASTWMLTTTTCISIGFVGKGKAQNTMASYAPLLMGSCS